MAAPDASYEEMVAGCIAGYDGQLSLQVETCYDSTGGEETVVDDLVAVIHKVQVQPANGSGGAVPGAAGGPGGAARSGGINGGAAGGTATLVEMSRTR